MTILLCCARHVNNNGTFFYCLPQSRRGLAFHTPNRKNMTAWQAAPQSYLILI